MSEQEVLLDDVAKALLKLRNTTEIKSFIKDVLTHSEQETLSLRFRIAKLLDKGIPYTQIERETGASSATIAKVSEYFKYGFGGYRTALERTKK